MKTDYDKKESVKLGEVASQFRANGYDVTIEPERTSLPEALRQFQLDLIAQRGDEFVVVEVKSRNEATNDAYLSKLADVISQLRGWHLELVLTGEGKRSNFSREVRAFTDEEVRYHLEAARYLIKKRNQYAAFLVAWSAMEALLRRFTGNKQHLIRNLDPGFVLKNAYSLGAISDLDLEYLLVAKNMRNAVVHGMADPAIDSQSVERLASITERILENLGKN